MEECDVISVVTEFIGSWLGSHLSGGSFQPVAEQCNPNPDPNYQVRR
jgi:hypothetical protein